MMGWHVFHLFMVLVWGFVAQNGVESGEYGKASFAALVCLTSAGLSAATLIAAEIRRKG